MEISRSHSDRNYVSYVDFNSNSKELTYCQRCHKLGIISRLGKRILEENQPVPSDYYK